MSHCLNLFQDAAGGIWKLDLSFTHTVSSINFYHVFFLECDVNVFIAILSNPRFFKMTAEVVVKNSLLIMHAGLCRYECDND